MSILELHAVFKSYGAVAAVAGVDLNVPAGSRTAVVGPSGCGKTTLLRLIAGFEMPDAGSVVFDGITLADATRLVPAHKRLIGYLPQNGALFPHLTVAENVGFGLPGRDVTRTRRIAELMELVSLDRAMLKRWPHELSGGQQQRVALARALAQQPKLMLLDEPFSALDAGLRISTRKAVAQVLSAAGVTTVLVTHDQAEALSFADQVAVMRDGRFAQIGRPLDLYLRPRDEAVAGFLGDTIVLPARLENGWANCRLGRVAVDDDQQTGPARILLRPEQVQLTAITGPVDAVPACIGTATDIDFIGHSCMVTVDLKGEGATPSEWGDAAPITVRCPSIQSPTMGAAVRIMVTGSAHVLVS